MKEWLLRKRWRIFFAGILIVAGPLLSLAALVNFLTIAALEDRVMKETGWFSETAAGHIEERLKSGINLGISCLEEQNHYFRIFRISMKRLCPGRKYSGDRIS